MLYNVKIFYEKKIKLNYLFLWMRVVNQERPRVSSRLNVGYKMKILYALCRTLIFKALFSEVILKSKYLICLKT